MRSIRRSSVTLVLAFAAFSSLAACSADATSPRLGSTSQAIAGGGGDTGDAASDVVVRLTSGPGTCTGTLITPMAVLTAKHCVMGDDSGKPGLAYPIQVDVGSSIASGFVRTYFASNITPTKVFGAQAPQPVGSAGDDLAIVFLDPPSSGGTGPAFDYARIVHPSLTSPCPTSGCGDGSGGSYDPPLGMAGWSPYDTSDVRQLAFDRDFEHYPGSPGGVGQYWQHNQGSVHVDPGDSGGPLFVVRTDAASGLPFRDVIGVAHGVQHFDVQVCALGDCDHDLWTDITRGQTADWVRAAMVDPVPRGPTWRAMHPGYSWYGDVGYLGAQRADDADGDHWSDAQDNCPTVSNWDQIDTDDDGVGDACPPLPPAPPAPGNCWASATCGGEISVRCDPSTFGTELDLFESGGFYPVASSGPSPYSFSFTSFNATRAGTLTLRVCAVNEDRGLRSVTCADPTLQVTPDLARCVVPPPPDVRCPPGEYSPGPGFGCRRLPLTHVVH